MGLHTPQRPRRLRQPPRLYTPSNRGNTLIKNYELNKERTKNKKQRDQNRNTAEMDKRGNLIITYSTSMYEKYIKEMNNIMKTIEEDENTSIEISERNTVDRKGTETEKTFRIKKTGNRQSCTINCYHTQSKLMINGKNKSIFHAEIHLKIVNKINQTNSPQTSNNVLDEVTSLLIQSDTETRQLDQNTTENIDIRSHAAANIDQRSSTSNDMSNLPSIQGQLDQNTTENIDLRSHVAVNIDQRSSTSNNMSNLPSLQGQTTQVFHSPMSQNETIPKVISTPNVIQNSHSEYETPQRCNTQNKIILINETQEETKPKSAHRHTSQNTSRKSIVTETSNETLIAMTDSQLICPICDETANDGTIECSRCEQWVHYSCENMTEADKDIHECDASETYICSSCFLDKLQEDETTTSYIDKPKVRVPQTNKQPKEKRISQNLQQKTITNKERKEYEDRFISMRTEIIRLEGIINEQKDTIRILRMRDNYENQDHDKKNQNGRIDRIENDYFRLRLDLLQMQINELSERQKHDKCDERLHKTTKKKTRDNY